MIQNVQKLSAEIDSRLSRPDSVLLAEAREQMKLMLEKLRVRGKLLEAVFNSPQACDGLLDNELMRRIEQELSGRKPPVEQAP